MTIPVEKKKRKTNTLLVENVSLHGQGEAEEHGDVWAVSDKKKR